MGFCRIKIIFVKIRSKLYFEKKMESSKLWTFDRMDKIFSKYHFSKKYCITFFGLKKIQFLQEIRRWEWSFESSSIIALFIKACVVSYRITIIGFQKTFTDFD